ncbi:MAG: hypothetical protein V4526_01815 [Patescibacteria group bacterium]
MENPNFREDSEQPEQQIHLEKTAILENAVTEVLSPVIEYYENQIQNMQTYDPNVLVDLHFEGATETLEMEVAIRSYQLGCKSLTTEDFLDYIGVFFKDQESADRFVINEDSIKEATQSYVSFIKLQKLLPISWELRGSPEDPNVQTITE